MPLISIITITFNAEKYLEKTIKSIDKQILKDFEYLLIDGGSTDSTLEIAKKYAPLFDKIISEKDKGLYEAMNKGLKLASGKYVWFINAGDEIAESDALQKIKQLDSSDPDVIFGETNLIDINGFVLGSRSELTPHKIPEILDWRNFNKGMLVCHQSFIVKRAIAPTYMDNNLSADIDWEINCLKKSKLNLKFSGILANYLIGGISVQQHRKSHIDRYFVLKKHFGFISNIKSHFSILLRNF